MYKVEVRSPVKNYSYLFVLATHLLHADGIETDELDFPPVTNENFDDLVSDYNFVSEGLRFEFEGDYRYVGPARFKSDPIEGKHLDYQDADASIYFTQKINCNNNLIWQLGLSYLHLGWKENPRFSQEDFTNAIASLGYATTSVENWRFVFNAGVTVDTKTFDFAQSGLYSGLIWGRYQYCQNLGLHVGVFGYVGIENGYTMPVAGVDWTINPDWSLNLIFPFNISLEHKLGTRWSASMKYVGFGGPYRQPRRIDGGTGAFRDGIIEVFSKGVELDFSYRQGAHLTAGFGAGWNGGGWILSKDRHNHHGKYFKFEGAPFGQANIDFGF